MLELAKQLGNVSQACKIMGYSRDSFYRFQELYRPESTYLGKGPTAQLTRIGAAKDWFSCLRSSLRLLITDPVLPDLTNRIRGNT